MPGCLHMSMDHLLSAGYLVESGVSSTSFSTHLLTFSNQQSEQVGISCKSLMDTFSPIHSGGRGANIYLKSEVSFPKKLFCQSLLSSQVQLQVL